MHASRLTLTALAAAFGLHGAALAADPPPPPAGGSILAWTPEQQRYGYRNMEKVTPVEVVARGAKVRELPLAASQIDPKWTWNGQAQTVDSYMTAMNTSGVVVLKDGQIVLERYGLDRKPDERWTSFSVAKSVTATLVGAAIKDGKIKSLDDVVTNYIPQLKGGAYEGVTVRQLLTMTSGVKWNEDYTDLNSDVAKAGVTPGEPGMNPIVSYMRKLPREAEPGAKFVYKTGETDLAGILVSNAVGKPLSTYLSEKIWAPYGMEQDAIWVNDVAGHERGGCCMSMTARDYARLGQFMLEGGKVNGQDILPEGWVADATKAHQSFPPGGVETGYGYFWWIIPGGYAAEGIFGQQIFVYPAEKLVIAINSAWPAASKDELWQAQMAFAQAVRRAAR
ncbi:CubicO group peptidase (beta-lactamase class C family) [Phenylobacterium haematophilum]|uniref:CubicO group peptidase (Beta-lactamase class C family) n=1 Tax=Phenylobacterium haematophilum TaxID=98513 RepID=A0A840A7A5_9CAUL|nr:serine hydrolase [Phenylobacterium haematophilum]MBB3893351.1 CubicO group peptidase (beta-lactamase class C family) [Phenylobacterium haematophilum]